MADVSTKQFIDISGINDEIVILKDGSLRSVVEVAAINFELRSNDEQAAITQGFQSFLNSIDFPIQIVVSSRKYDINDYIKIVEAAGNEATNELLKIQAAEYGKFVKEISTLANIMSKKFYVVIPFYVFEKPTGKGFLATIKNVFGGQGKAIQIDEAHLQTYRNQMAQRTELVFGGLAGLGVKIKTLRGQELMNVFYGLYNPGSKLSANADT